ncbi:MAG: RimK family alpha-L-glutamate ligase [Candidatus Bathyarchaeota archaeon]|nr:RimK family alpha-L-glutamate ligase [Candidatus Bathyarchaeota archaeon]
MGIMTRDGQGWCSTQLQEAMKKRNITPVCFGYKQIIGRIKYAPEISVDDTDALKDLAAIITRPIARGSIEEIMFRMNLLHKLERSGMLIINPPLSIERAVDKYYSLTLLEENNIPVPRTAVTENHDEALKCFEELGGDIVLKPVFGSRGMGATRISDSEVAARVFRTITFYRGVLYQQEFIPHGNSDIRAFVIGDKVVAAMRRVSSNWKTNVSLGAQPVFLNLSTELENLAVKASKIIGCRIAGVDLMEGPNGPVVLEINSQPGWNGLQSVTEVNIADEIISYVLSELKA